MKKEINMFDPAHYDKAGYIIANLATISRPLFSLATITFGGMGKMHEMAICLGLTIFTELDGRIARGTSSETIHGALRDNLADLSMRTMFDLIGPIVAINMAQDKSTMMTLLFTLIGIEKLIIHTILCKNDVPELLEYYKQDLDHVELLRRIHN